MPLEQIVSADDAPVDDVTRDDATTGAEVTFFDDMFTRCLWILSMIGIILTFPISLFVCFNVSMTSL